METTKRTPMKIALVQFEGAICEVEANTAHACDLIAEAARNGADLVVLPELFSTGYNLDIVGPRILDLAERVDGPTVAALRAAGRENNVYVIAGLALVKEQLPAVAFNSSVFIDRAGELMGTFDKAHLWALERFYFRSGNELPVFDTEFGKVGVMICYDMGFPEVARILALKGAELIVCPSAWCEEDHDVWNYNTQCRALENTVFLAAVNRHGREDDLYMGGHTRVCNPRGAVIAELAEEAEGILYAELDFEQLKTFRTASPYLRDRRPDLYDEVKLWP